MKTSFSMLSVLLLAACGGGQTGDLSGRNDGGGQNVGGQQCEDILHPLSSLDETTSLGFSAAQVLEFAEGEFTAPIVWGTPNNVTFGPESGTGELTMTVTYDGGAIHFVDSVPQAGTGEGLLLGGPGCADSIRIDVTVSVQTAGGALAETFETTLDARSLVAASFSKDLDPEALGGSFEILSVTPAEGQVKQFGLNATLTPFGATGTLSSIVEVQGASVVSAGWVTYATFPGSGACADDPESGGDDTGFPTSITADVRGFSGAQAIEQWNAATPITVAWRDGTETELTLVATSEGDGCVRLGAWYDEELYRATYPVRIVASSADGRLDGEYTGKIEVVPDASGNVTRIFGSASVPLTLDQAGQSGFSELGDLSEYHRLHLKLSSTLSQGEFSGFLGLDGLTDPPCVTEPPPIDPSGMGAPGCEGTHVTPIEKAQWGTPGQ